MNRRDACYGHIRERAQAFGLIARGGFHPGADDAVPPLADGRAARTVVLVGNAGDTLWPVFSASPEAADGRPHPLDRWSRRVLGAIAAELGGAACLPNDGPPWPPFVAWARRAEPVTESPIGILVHPDYGLWHAYRGAILLDRAIALPAPDRRPPPCATCPDQPCRRACPVGAFAPEGYDVTACTGFLSAEEGARCGGGCLARRACPVGQHYNYPRAQQALHLDAFLVAQGRRARFGNGS
ncbi:MAG: hypothetical protein U5K43_13780 [Halofilum sp. (in: g-proteobacteria)]|nr:hypothetical protein [Halofilum sp. (in: g-proteobacteria)]